MSQKTLAEAVYLNVFIYNNGFLYFLYISLFNCCSATNILDKGKTLAIVKVKCWKLYLWGKKGFPVPD